ncbi:unnamed protein product [Adineta steineri]|uniref:Uncharacterized protein n=2 Tax=Adineta steineri TaxID=433720 RepID=A0A815I7T6_9BILA|nr:unnamed protein product [Adineta steineri]
MAMANKTQCFTCHRENNTFTCEGCSKRFCAIHLPEHLQRLNEELHHIIDDYNEFKERINEQKQNSQNHSLIEQIDQWEKISIEKVKQKAQNWRETVIESSQTFINNIEMKFNDLNIQIQQLQKETDFNEVNLNYLRNQLRKITEELNSSSNISIQQDSKAFINEISIISLKKVNSKFNKWEQNAITVAGGNGKGNKLNELNALSFIFVDDDQSVYVSDQENHRVMKWRKDAKEGTIVAGGNRTRLSYAQGVIVDHLGQIYVADYLNHRVMRWCEGKEEGEIVVGGNGEGNQSDQLHYPRGICFDDEGNLYVVDSENNRIQKFKIICE